MPPWLSPRRRLPAVAGEVGIAAEVTGRQQLDHSIDLVRCSPCGAGDHDDQTGFRVRRLFPFFLPLGRCAPANGSNERPRPCHQICSRTAQLSFEIHSLLLSFADLPSAPSGPNYGFSRRHGRFLRFDTSNIDTLRFFIKASQVDSSRFPRSPFYVNRTIYDVLLP
jgi:hypothetical protein